MLPFHLFNRIQIQHNFPQRRSTFELVSEPVADTTFTEKIKIWFQRNKRTVKLARVTILNLLVGVYFAWATFHYFDLSELGLWKRFKLQKKIINFAFCFSFNRNGF